MKYKKIKAVVLCLLIISSIYQTIMLWFDNVSDRNFFYSLIDKATVRLKDSKTSMDKQYMISPKQLGVYLGASDKDFTILKKGDMEYDYNIIYSECIKVIIKAINKDNLSKTKINKEELWEDRGIVFNLPLSISNADLAKDLNINQSAFEGLSSLKSIVIIPAKEKNNFLKVFLIDELTNDIYGFTLAEKEVRESNIILNDLISKAENKNMPIYISTLKNDIDLFEGNILLPLASENMTYCSSLKLSTPYVLNNTFQKEKLEKYINSFFVNPNVKWTTQNNDVMIYGDDNALVRYNKNGLLEYSSIVNNQYSAQSISDSFNVAERFLKIDSLLFEDGYYLIKYIEEKDKAIFYYGYSYEGFPLHLEDKLLSDNNMKYPIEIIVEKGKVVKCKRLVLDIKETGKDEALNSQFEDYLDVFVKRNKVEKEQLEDMYLGYVKKGENAKMMWVIKFQGELYELE